LVIERAFHIGALGRHQSNLTADYKFPKLVLLAYRTECIFFNHSMETKTGTKRGRSRWHASFLLSGEARTLMNAIFSLSILGVAGFVTIATGCSLWLGSLHR
jgi:hypothetical protein